MTKQNQRPKNIPSQNCLKLIRKERKHDICKADVVITDLNYQDLTYWLFISTLNNIKEKS